MLKKDSFITGLLIGILFPIVMYGLIQVIFYYQQLPVSLPLVENLQLFLIAVNGILFWYFMVKREQEKTGKGLFIVTFIYVFIYVIVYHV